MKLDLKRGVPSLLERELGRGCAPLVSIVKQKLYILCPAGDLLSFGLWLVNDLHIFGKLLTQNKLKIVSTV